MATFPKFLEDILGQPHFKLFAHWLREALNIQPQKHGHYFHESPADVGRFQTYTTERSAFIKVGVRLVRMSEVLMPSLSFFSYTAEATTEDDWEKASLCDIAILDDLSVSSIFYDYSPEESVNLGMIPVEDDQLHEIRRLISFMNDAGRDFIQDVLKNAKITPTEITSQLHIPTASKEEL